MSSSQPTRVQRRYLRTRRSERTPTPVPPDVTTQAISSTANPVISALTIEEPKTDVTDISNDNGSEASGVQTNEETEEVETRIRSSKTRSLVLSMLEPHRLYHPDESYFPFPKVTFLIDQPKELTCQICLGATCKSKSKREDLSIFSILPCGHVAGYKCMKKWLNEKSVCPFCRFNMKYPGCGHDIPPRPMTKDNLYLVPRTIPDRGHIPDLCTKCHRKHLMDQAMSQLKNTKHDFEEARRRFYETSGVEEEEIMMEKKEAFESVMLDEALLPHLCTWLTSW